ncbi:MAG: MFS transporter [Dehalococcoidia bacterium]|nr:MFS transporter [Dehalococcoidia bacterium]
MAKDAKASGSALSLQQTLSLYTPALVMALGNGIIAPALPVYVKSFNVSFAVAALAIVLYQAGAFVCAFPTGYLLDKIGRRPILLAGPIILAVTSLLIAFSETFEQLLILRFIGGAAEQMWMMARLAVISDTAATGQRGKQITWMTALNRVGDLGGPAVGGFLAAAFDVRIPFVIYGVIVFLAIVPSFFLVKESKPADTDRTKEGSGGKSDWGVVLAAVLSAQIMAFLVAQFCANVARMGFQSGTIILYAAYAYDAGPQQLGLMASAAGLLSLPIVFSTGPIMDRFGRKKVMVPGFFLVGMMAFGLAATTIEPAPFPIFVGMYTLQLTAQSITGGTMQVLGSDLAPETARGRFFAVWRMIANLASTLGPGMVAFLSDVASFTVAFGVIGVMGVTVSLLLAMVVRETVTARPRESAPP